MFNFFTSLETIACYYFSFSLENYINFNLIFIFIKSKLAYDLYLSFFSKRCLVYFKKILL